MALDRITIDPAVWALRPDFAVLAIVAEGLTNGPSDDLSRHALRQAEATTRAAGTESLDPHVVAWQECFRAFGAKPQRTASSVEALWRRAVSPAGLPEINRLVDAYNAVSVEHRLPIGGEDLDHFLGSIRLVRAVGDEAFETVKDGQPLVEPPAPGEVVWADARGVTCRRWNWRQGTRTRLTETTTRGLFLLERLAPYPLEALDAAGEVLIERLREVSPEARFAVRRFGG